MSRVKWKNREGLSEYAVRWNWVEDSSDSGFTAVLRVKDEARSLPWVLPGVLRSVEQTIVVDNGSTDGTPEVALRVAEELGFGERLRVLSYPFAVSRCGPEHLWTYPDSVHSLTYFYNWSFSHVQTRYALKWDGDMVLTPEGRGCYVILPGSCRVSMRRSRCNAILFTWRASASPTSTP